MDDEFQQVFHSFVAQKRRLFPISSTSPSDGTDKCRQEFADPGSLEDFVELTCEQRERRLVQNVRIGDVFLCEITGIEDYGLDLHCLEVSCLNGSKLVCIVDDTLPWTVTCPVAELPRDDDKEYLTEGFEIGDVVRTVAAHCQRGEAASGRTYWTVSLRPHRLKEQYHDSIALEILREDERDDILARTRTVLRNRRRLLVDSDADSAGGRGKDFLSRITEQAAFRNPSCVQNLLRQLGINSAAPCSLLKSSVRLSELPRSEAYRGLRERRARVVSCDMMQEGVDLMKQGKEKEAFERLNGAIKTDPNNADAKVARGALHANRGDFSAAILDFSAVMETHPDHQNGRRYWADTKTAFAKQLERAMKLQRAFGHVTDVLKVVPDHQAGLELERALKPHVSLVSPERVSQAATAGSRSGQSSQHSSRSGSHGTSSSSSSLDWSGDSRTPSPSHRKHTHTRRIRSPSPRRKGGHHKEKKTRREPSRSPDSGSSSERYKHRRKAKKERKPSRRDKKRKKHKDKHRR